MSSMRFLRRRRNSSHIPIEPTTAMTPTPVATRIKRTSGLVGISVGAKDTEGAGEIIGVAVGTLVGALVGVVAGRGKFTGAETGVVAGACTGAATGGGRLSSSSRSGQFQ